MNPAMLEDRSGLFNEISGFSQRKLKKVETKVCTGTGENVVEKRGAKGLQTVDPSKNKSSTSNEPLKKLDLQVGLVAPGIMIGQYFSNHFFHFFISSNQFFLPFFVYFFKKLCHGLLSNLELEHIRIHHVMIRNVLLSSSSCFVWRENRERENLR